MAQSNLPDLPLEVQYLILESSDWLEQSVLRQVCTTWQEYIDTSTTLLDGCYQGTIQTCKDAIENGSIPQFHNVINYRSGFVKTPTGFTACILHRNDAGGVVDWSPEADLSIYLSDPLLKPGTGRLVNGLHLTVKDIDGNTKSTGVKWDIGYDGSVNNFLRATRRGVGYVAKSDWKYWRIWPILQRIDDDDDVWLSLVVQPEREAHASAAYASERTESLLNQLSLS